jgi:predicted Rossmann fold flavoprotein
MGESYDVIVIGAGASGMMAAGQAAQMGAHTLLLEKMERPGRKLFISGKGRCNLTNTAPIQDFIEHFGQNGRFLRQAFHRFFTQDLLEFFKAQGVATLTERGGRVFPTSESAQDVIDALERFCYQSGVNLRLNTPVEHVVVVDQQVKGVAISQGVLSAENVIIATGGASYPGTGSTGDGYRLAESVGHQIIPIRPALVPLITAGDIAQKCQGLSLRNVEIAVWRNDKKTDQAFGEMLFTHFGVSGPIILTLSRQVVDALQAKEKVQISIDLKPALDEAKLDARLIRDLNANGKKQFHTILKGLLPQKLIPVCLELVEIPAEKLCHQITAEDRTRLRNWLKDSAGDCHCRGSRFARG